MLYINDRIHGSIEVSDLAQSIIDTSEYQRLRRICQSGILKLVFPSANHSRFEHSLGVYHLAKTFAKNLTFNLEIKKKDKLVELIGIAGLVHDLGHLAFSHLFEDFLKNTGYIFHHEELSQKLFRKLCSDYKINLDNDEIEKIITLIHPNDNWENGFEWQGENIGKWVYQIVACPDTGIDVDKFDYLLRDSLACGLKVSFHFDRIIKMTKIINGEIVYPWKLRYNIFEMYLSRYHLHLNVFHHKTVIALEIIISEILTELGKEYNFREKIENYDILDLTDEIIYKYSNPKIKELLNKIETRNLPKIVPKNEAKYLIPIKNSLCSEEENPLEKIKYFNKYNNIVNAKIKDYGILASQKYTQNIIYYFNM